MSKRASFWFALSAVAATVVLAVGAVLFTLRLSDSDAQRLGGAGTAVAAVGGLVGLVVLIVYTRETLLLRLTAEQQLENGSRPVVLFELSTKDWKLDEPLALRDCCLRNIGFGPAFNVTVAPIHGIDLDLLIPAISLIEAKGTSIVQNPTVRLKVQDPERSVEGSNRGGNFALARLREAIRDEEFPADPTVTVEFHSVSGKRYRVTETITRLEPHGVRTDFVRMDHL